MNAQYLGALVTLVAALMGATVTLWLGFGRRQRLRLAIEVREGVAQDQRFQWDEMVRRDVTAITRASYQPIKPGPLWIFGVLFSLASFIPGMPPAIRVTFQLLSIASTLTAGIAAFVYWRRVRTHRQDLEERIERKEAEVERLEAQKAEAEQQLATLSHAVARRLDWRSRALYVSGAPMALVRQSRTDMDLSQLPEPETHFDLPSYRLRRRLRLVSPFRKRYDFTGYQPSTGNEAPGVYHHQDEASDQQSRTPHNKQQR
jgi:hypothetical protein